MDAVGQRVSNIMQTQFVSVGPNERVDFADQLFKLGRFRHLPVLSTGQLVGIVSSRDLMKAALTEVLDFEPGQRRVFFKAIEISEVMTRRVVSARADTPLPEATARMVKQKIGCLPVVDADGVMIGLITETDLLRAAYLDGATEAGEDAEYSEDGGT